MLIFNEDPDARVYRTEAGTMREEYLYPAADLLKDSKVGTFFVCVNAMRANFPSRVLQPFTEGFDANLGINQPYMMGETSDWGYRRAANFRALESQGVDSNAVLLKRASENGIPAGISVRMNDQHGLWLKKSLMMSSFYLEHPEYRIRHMSPEPALDFAQEPVRRKMVEFIAEVLERYPAESLELDWMRHPPYFDSGKGREHCGCLTEMTEQISALVRKREKTCGHGIRLYAAVPSGIDTALDYGMDAVDWARRGLVDGLILAPKYIRDITIDPRPWRKAIGNAAVSIAVRIERACHAYPGAPMDDMPIVGAKMNPEMLNCLTRGAAWTAYHRGADSVELFNYMAARNQPENASIFTDCASVETLAGRKRSFMLTYNDLDMSDWLFFPGWRKDGVFDAWVEQSLAKGTYPYQLPRPIYPGKAERFEFASGPVKESGARISVTLAGLPETARVWIAGARCRYENGAWYAPEGTVSEEDITVLAESDATARVTGAMLTVDF